MQGFYLPTAEAGGIPPLHPILVIFVSGVYFVARLTQKCIVAILSNVLDCTAFVVQNTSKRRADEPGIRMVEELPSDTINFNDELKNPRLIAFLFARSYEFKSVEDISLTEIFTEVTVPVEETKREIEISIFIRIAGDLDESAYISMYNPKQEMVEFVELLPPRDLQLYEEAPNYVEFVEVISFVFFELGVYWFDVRFKGKSLGMVPLLVRAEV